MARKRMIQPEFFTSEKVASLPKPSRLTWVGLWTYCDDAGRGRDHAGLVKGTVWPLDDDYTAKKVQLDLDRFAKLGFICRYVVDGSRYLHIVWWTDHQKINRPTESKIPPCQRHEQKAWDEWEEASRGKRESLSEGFSESLREGLTPKVVEVSSVQGSSSVSAPVAVKKGCGFHRSKPSATCLDCAETPTPPNVKLVLAEQDRLAREA